MVLKLKQIMSALVLIPVASAVCFADRGPGQGRAHCNAENDAQAYQTRFVSQWFNDVTDFDNHLISRHENHNLPDYKRRYCAEYDANAIGQRILNDPNANTLAFENPPGTFRTYLCWLHSRFQRSATYLTNYRPELPRPNRNQAIDIISQIVAHRNVVEIPGFRNLNEFSTVYREEITAALNSMATGCFFNPGDCGARITDPYHPSPSDLRTTMDDLYDRVVRSRGDIQFLRVRRLRDEPLIANGFRSHAVNLLSMDPIYDDPQHPERDFDRASPREYRNPITRHPITGYRLRWLDSNSPHTVVDVRYHYGDTQAGRFVPQLHYEYAGDIPEMNAAIEQYCRH